MFINYKIEKYAVALFLDTPQHPQNFTDTIIGMNS